MRLFGLFADAMRVDFLVFLTEGGSVVHRGRDDVGFIYFFAFVDRSTPVSCRS
jgi:hypothetical protein